MKEFIDKKGEEILKILGAGSPKRISEKIEDMFNLKRSPALVWKMLTGKVPATYPPSAQTYEIVGLASLKLIEEKYKSAEDLLLNYEFAATMEAA